jgi:hypothetical protein
MGAFPFYPHTSPGKRALSRLCATAADFRGTSATMVMVGGQLHALNRPDRWQEGYLPPFDSRSDLSISQLSAVCQMGNWPVPVATDPPSGGLPYFITNLRLPKLLELLEHTYKESRNRCSGGQADTKTGVLRAAATRGNDKNKQSPHPNRHITRLSKGCSPMVLERRD